MLTLYLKLRNQRPKPEQHSYSLPKALCSTVIVCCIGTCSVCLTAETVAHLKAEVEQIVIEVSTAGVRTLSVRAYIVSTTSPYGSIWVNLPPSKRTYKMDSS